MNQKTIALVSNNYWTLYKFRYDVIQMFIEEGYIVHLVAKEDIYHRYFTHKNIHIHFLSLEERGVNIFRELFAFISIYKLHKKIKPSLIFNFTMKPNIYSNIAARMLGIKTVSMITGLGHIFIKANSLLRGLVIILLRISLKNTDQLWFTNKFDRDYFKKMKIVKNQKVSIVPGAGVIISKKEISRKINNGKNIFLMVSRLLKEKGTAEFLKAAAYFKNDSTKNFILIGAHSNDKDHIPIQLLSRMCKEGTIKYHPYTDNIDKFMSDADCLIHPSYREGMSTILLEAASYKIPIITSEVPGCIDIVPNEKYGFLCKKGNVKTLIEQIVKFANINANDSEIIDSMVNNTYNHVSTNFDRSIILKKFKETVGS
tara:strand:- start:473 stop:1585 length:1113 start_codon:yes stop_codon:yes gene_type:complete